MAIASPTMNVGMSPSQCDQTKVEFAQTASLAGAASIGRNRRQTDQTPHRGGSAAILRPQTLSRLVGLCSTLQVGTISNRPAVCPRRHLVTATRVHIACNRATARCIASTSAAVVSSFPLLHIPLKAAPSSMTILS